MTFKKWQKPPKKWQKMTEVEVKENVLEEETPVTTDVENEITNEVVAEVNRQWDEIIWTIWKTVVAKPKWRICFEAQVAPVPMFKLPEDIRKYLVNHWFSSDVYKKDKEWLEKHGADMNIIKKLKEYLTNMN